MERWNAKEIGRILLAGIVTLAWISWCLSRIFGDSHRILFTHLLWTGTIFIIVLIFWAPFRRKFKLPHQNSPIGECLSDEYQKRLRLGIRPRGWHC